MEIRAPVFVGASVDGFIARANHELDFLPAGGEDHGCTDFVKSVDAHVIGRNTYEKVLTFKPWANGPKPEVVLSSRPVRMPRARGAAVERMPGDPRGVLAQLAPRGSKHVYVDGGATITRFLEAGLVQRLIITRVPVLIGGGIPLFGALSRDIQLEHVATRHYQSGLVRSEYRVLGGGGAFESRAA